MTRSDGHRNHTRIGGESIIVVGAIPNRNASEGVNSMTYGLINLIKIWCDVAGSLTSSSRIPIVAKSK